MKMIDNVCLKLPRKGNEGIIDILQHRWWRDTHTYSGDIQNMGVFVGLDSIIIHGSLAKYLNGENVSNLTISQVEKAIRKLENEIGLYLDTAIVKMVECGISIITNEQPAEYLKLFGYPARYTRHEYATITGVETVTYSTQTGSYQFSGYNKVVEVQRKKKQSIPALLEGANILRLEYRIIRRRGINAKFKSDLTAYNLFNPVVYRELQNLFIEAYQAIPKFGMQYHIETLEKVTPKIWIALLAEQYRQTFPKEYMYLLKVLRESGALTDKNLERIRAANRMREMKYRLIDKSPLIAELDTYVMDMMGNDIEL
ncbi:MAG: hypothetical protein LBV17_01270 [Treponema sp.]|jgi:hypothetical protein|nr:hypothetical protein [Treponema sp.]